MNPRKGKRRVWARQKNDSEFFLCSDGARIRKLSEAHCIAFTKNVAMLVESKNQKQLDMHRNIDSCIKMQMHARIESYMQSLLCKA